MSPHAPNAFNELATETLGDMKVTGTASFLVICITCVGVGGRVRDLKFLWILLQVFLDNNGCKIGYHVTIIWKKNPSGNLLQILTHTRKKNVQQEKRVLHKSRIITQRGKDLKYP